MKFKRKLWTKKQVCRREVCDEISPRGTCAATAFHLVRPKLNHMACVKLFYEGQDGKERGKEWSHFQAYLRKHNLEINRWWVMWWHKGDRIHRLRRYWILATWSKDADVRPAGEKVNHVVVMYGNKIVYDPRFSNGTVNRNYKVGQIWVITKHNYRKQSRPHRVTKRDRSFKFRQ